MRTGVMLMIGLLSGVTASAQEKEAHEKAEASEAAKVAPALATALKDSKVSLASGVRAAAKEGQPISGKFEVEDAMGKAKHTLADVIAGAEKSHPGFHAVSIMPEIEDGAAQADVTLLKGSTSKQIEQPL